MARYRSDDDDDLDILSCDMRETIARHRVEEAVEAKARTDEIVERAHDVFGKAMALNASNNFIEMIEALISQTREGKT